MEDFVFPIVSTKTSEGKTFDLTDSSQRKAYFEYKVGKEIKKLRDYLKDHQLIAYFLGKKSSGKGTYAKILAEILGGDTIVHFSIGDMVRSFDSVLADPQKKTELIQFLTENYRGFLSLEKIIESLEGRSTKVLLPTELIITLAKREIQKIGQKTIFIDGFPRDIDQLAYTLFFKDIIGRHADRDLFVLIDVPTSVIDERVKFRVICPLCQTSRNTKLLPTKEVEYDVTENKFYLHCDNSNCSKPRMVIKEGDEFGIGPIKTRLEKDGLLIKEVSKIAGMAKICLRNSIPLENVKEVTDEYEITPEYTYQWDENQKKVKILEKAWEVADDSGQKVNSLTPPPVVVSLIKQLARGLGL